MQGIVLYACGIVREYQRVFSNRGLIGIEALLFRDDDLRIHFEIIMRLRAAAAYGLPVLCVVTTIVRFVRPGGLRAVVAETVPAKHQLLILNRSRQRAPNLLALDRLIAGICSLWIRPNNYWRRVYQYYPVRIVTLNWANWLKFASKMREFELVSCR